jgi:hypothetical protein
MRNIRKPRWERLRRIRRKLVRRIWRSEPEAEAGVVEEMASVGVAVGNGIGGAE